MLNAQALNSHSYPATQMQQDNLDELLRRLTIVQNTYGIQLVVTSGLRSQADQARINPSAPQSKHLTGCAADIEDKDGKLRAFVLANLEAMAITGLWFEDFRWTPGWVHFQIIGPSSGHRIFVPSSAAPTAPSCWDGVYDHSLDY